MDDRTIAAPSLSPPAAPAKKATERLDARATARRRLFPTVYYLRQGARRRIPKFGFDAADGGAGTDGGIARNALALDAVEIKPSYGLGAGPCQMEVELFGRRYAAPFGIAPIGMPGVVWPGAEKCMARAAHRARVPYVAGVISSFTLEELAEIARDVLWFQLYRMVQDDHRYGIDLVRRAQSAGAQVLVITIDVPTRAKRPREVRRGLVLPFRLDVATVWDILTHPAWLMAYREHGLQRFKNYDVYVDDPTPERVTAFAQLSDQYGGAFSWDEIARYRDIWRGPLVIKGILHPQDAAKAVTLGIDGIQVSNHGGRQSEGLPASIDVLPSIISEVGRHATVLFDSGVRSGLDILRALALGAKAAFAGKAFLYGLGAIGDEGANYVIELFAEELRDAMRQVGIKSIAEAPMILSRHPGLWQP